MQGAVCLTELGHNVFWSGPLCPNAKDWTASSAQVATICRRTLNVPCATTGFHEEEHKLPHPVKRSVRPFSSSRSSATASTTSASSSRGGRFKKSHGSYLTAVEELEEEEGDDEDLEKDPEAYEAYMQDQHQQPDEDEDEEELEEEVSEDESLTAEDLKEAWAARWRAKDQVAEKRKARTFAILHCPRPHAEIRSLMFARPLQLAPAVVFVGIGDPECIKVKSGEDKPFQFQPKTKPKNVYFVTNDSKPFSTVGQHCPDKKGLTVHEVNFTFVVGDGKAKREKRSEADARVPPAAVVECPRCQKPMNYKANFCSDCGSSMAVPRMADQDDEGGWELLNYASSSEEEVPGRFSQPSNSAGRPSSLAPRAKPLVAPPWKTSDAQSALDALPNMSRSEKRELYRHLSAEQEQEQGPVVPKASTADAPGRERTLR